MRRAELYEKTDKLDEALADYQKILELDPSQHSAREACMVCVFVKQGRQVYIFVSVTISIDDLMVGK